MVFSEICISFIVIMNETPSKRRRTELSLEDKIKIIRESEMVPKPTLKVCEDCFSF
jgi:hypothetical protein